MSASVVQSGGGGGGNTPTGSAGSPNAAVVSVQGIAGGVAMPVSFSGGGLALETGGNLATVAAAQGNGATGVTIPTGGLGILGWLSGIYNKLAGTLAVSGVFWQTTQPISAASLPLPAGAATSAKQPALGTAGSGSADVISVQGVTSMTALKVDASSTTQPVSGTFWPATQPVSAASLPLPAGASTSAKQPALGTAGSASADVLTVQGVTSMTALKVDGSATTQPVSNVSLPLPAGAATSAKQPALGTVGAASADVLTVQGAASMTPLKVDASATTQPVSGAFWQATQPVSNASLPLPTGAATSAKQPALGTAGSASTDVLTVQGAASMTALKVDASATTQPISGNVGVNNNPVAPAGMATAQTAMVSTQTLIAAARTGAIGTGRVNAALYNAGSSTVYVGNTGVTTSTGLRILPGGSLDISTTAAIYGICASSTSTVVDVLETF